MIGRFSPQRTYSVARKEFLHIIRDPGTLFFALFIPVLELFMLGYAIDTNVRNNVKAGAAVPMKFSLGGNFGLQIFQAGYPGWIYITTGIDGDDVEETVTAGGSSLTYDSVAKQYVYVLKTDKAWAGKSVRIYMRFIDGTEKYADFNCLK